MKRNSCILALGLVLLFSCSKEELKYSCDAEVDQFVVENQDLLKSANVELLSSYSLEVQKAAYRSYTSARKLEVWTEKLEALLTGEDFNTNEKEHILKLKNQLTEELFVPDNLIEFNASIDYYVNWENYAYDELGWDTQIMQFVVSSLELSYAAYTESTSNLLKSTRAGDCNCNVGHDFCDEAFECIESGNCNIAQIDGCGLFWSEDCDGNCIHLN